MKLAVTTRKQFDAIRPVVSILQKWTAFAATQFETDFHLAGGKDFAWKIANRLSRLWHLAASFQSNCATICKPSIALNWTKLIDGESERGREGVELFLVV